MDDEYSEGWWEVPISALEHYGYCPRQCALIHVEQTYEENVFTMRGSLAHDRVDSGDDAANRGVPALRGIPLWSDKLGLRGRADAVEMREGGPYPVEYKIGRRRGIAADLQLCAQALCLEEMLGASVTKGAIFYHEVRKRHEVRIDEDLRGRTLKAIEEIREMLGAQRLPDAPNDARCKHCSLIDVCLPSVVGEPDRLRGLQGALWYHYDVKES